MRSRRASRSLAGALLVGSLLVGSLLVGSLLVGAPVLAAGGPQRLGLVIGVNRSVDADLKPLRYADDDAVRYAELFTQLGARVELLTRLDKATARLFPRAKREAKLPRLLALERAVERLRLAVAAAKVAGRETELFLVYAGHGRPRRLKDRKVQAGYISLEDARLTAPMLARKVLRRVGATRTHVIVDACHSYFLALARGPGGTRRHVSGFSRLAGALQAPSVGLLLSTSSARESHEWAAFQAGVFSHAVRSGLRGAADANGDGAVTYREIAAFITRANASIPNERYRSKVFARAPARRGVLLSLGARRADAIEIGPSRAGRYLLEDERGVRLADLHSTAKQTVLLLRPRDRRLYLRRLSLDPKADDVEYRIEPGSRAGRVVVAALTSTPPHVASRGAAHEAFSKLFALPFDSAVVARYVAPRATLPHGAAQRPNARDDRGLGALQVAKWTTLGLAAAALGSGLALTLAAKALRDDAPPSESQQERLQRNDRIDTRNTAATVLYVAGGAAALTSLVLFLWPDDDPSEASLVQSINLTPTPRGAALSVTGRF